MESRLFALVSLDQTLSTGIAGFCIGFVANSLDFIDIFSRSFAALVVVVAIRDY